MDRINKGRRTGRFYHSLLQRYYRFLIPPGLTILELGCGQGDLLNILAPEVGVGVDFSIPMIKQAQEKYPHLDFVCADVHQLAFSARFDIIILSDLVNDLWDVQSVLAGIRPLCHAGTRIIINFFNNIWRIPFELARKCHLAADMLDQNWLTPMDIFNLLRLSGFEPLGNRTRILFPARCPLLEAPANRFLINFLPFQWFGLTNYIVARPLSPPENRCHPLSTPVVSIIVPAKNEAGNIPDLLQQTKLPGYDMELIFIEGGSTDGTEEAIRHAINESSNRNIRFIKQPGQGKGDAVRAGFNRATGDILVILDADMTVPPECLPRFIEALATGKGEFINGVRLVYPLEDQSMRFLNMVFNKAFGLLLSWLLDQPVKDTLCGTKALWKKDYEKMKQNPDGLSLMDPFGDFDLLFNAARINLKIIDLPVRYRRRTYGMTKIRRWRHGWILLKLVFLAARRIKFR
jgi:SAM-dependent methyltransferase